MTKILSQTAQISLLKRLRRMCPFAVWSGQWLHLWRHEEWCALVLWHGAQTKEARHCHLNCIDLRKAAFRNGYDITLSTHKLNAYG